MNWKVCGRKRFIAAVPGSAWSLQSLVKAMKLCAKVANFGHKIEFGVSRIRSRVTNYE
jgi:hypothetical protein